ncbi:hypothetical protein VTH82DRAFT_2361 [Thermothelomyces myriococcoides]
MAPLLDDGPHSQRAQTNADGLDHSGSEPPEAHKSHDPERPQIRNSGYTNHIRSASRITWDGSEPLPRNRSPSPQPRPGQSRLSSPPPRPSSATSLSNYYPAPEHGRLTALADRWSYDRERMPSPPPATRGSRPGTPMGDPDTPVAARVSRPASTLAESRSQSRAPSRAQSGIFDITNGSAESDDSLPPFSDFDQGGQQLSPHLRQSCHILTGEEMEMLARPPPSHPPMTASTRPSSSSSPPSSPPDYARGAAGVSAVALPPPPAGRGPESASSTTPPPKPSQPREGLDRHPNRNSVIHGSDHSFDLRPSCLGLCDIAPVRAVLGKVGAWVMGVVTPVSFGLLTGCLASMMSGCR